MPTHADLEIGLRWLSKDDCFDVSVAYDQPEDAEDRRQLGTEPLVINVSELRVLVGESYDKRLSEQFFASPEIQRFYARARDDAEQSDLLLHLRLLIDPSAPSRFHTIRWECLRDPSDDTPIAMKRYVLLSRYLGSATWRRLTPKARHETEALIVIAAPSDAAEWGLAEIDRPSEQARAADMLDSIHPRELTGPGDATVDKLLDELDRPTDVLYLVCHGALVNSTPTLYLEHEDGTTATIDGNELIQRINSLQYRPTVAVLCSCQSAGSTVDDGSGLVAFGPQLAASGVAAVVAMNGRVTTESAELFLRRFFGEFQIDGAVDRAVATARSALAGRADWWMPVLFSRLRSGRTWYEPGFSKDPKQTWQGLLRQIDSKPCMCTPVLGPGLSDPILGSRQQIARRWVERWQMPIAPDNLEDLAKVAQYLGVRYAPGMVANELWNYLASELKNRYSEYFTADELERNSPEQLLATVGRARRKADPTDAYGVIAEIRSPVFVTTAWSSLLEDALTDAGRPPDVQSFQWNVPPNERAEHAFTEPSPEAPLVYHMFGTLDDPESIVLSEDNYFAWMDAWIKRRVEIPDVVATALTRRGLLFVGHRLDDWDFRFLFHGIKTFEAKGQLRRNFHVGVQLDPQIQMTEPDAAQDYLEKLLGEDRVSVYWGSVEQFMDEFVRARGSDRS